MLFGHLRRWTNTFAIEGVQRMGMVSAMTELMAQRMHFGQCVWYDGAIPLPIVVITLRTFTDNSPGKSMCIHRSQEYTKTACATIVLVELSSHVIWCGVDGGHQRRLAS